VPASCATGVDQGTNLHFGIEPHHGEVLNPTTQPAPAPFGSEHHCRHNDGDPVRRISRQRRCSPGAFGAAHEFRRTHDREGGIRERVSDSCGTKPAALHRHLRQRHSSGRLEGRSYARQKVREFGIGHAALRA
jgi:hypothetical protein